jgi:hypothetical protein
LGNCVVARGIGCVDRTRALTAPLWRGGA